MSVSRLLLWRAADKAASTADDANAATAAGAAAAAADLDVKFFLQPNDTKRMEREKKLKPNLLVIKSG